MSTDGGARSHPKASQGSLYLACALIFEGNFGYANAFKVRYGTGLGEEDNMAINAKSGLQEEMYIEAKLTTIFPRRKINIVKELGIFDAIVSEEASRFICSRFQMSQVKAKSTCITCATAQFSHLHRSSDRLLKNLYPLRPTLFHQHPYPTTIDRTPTLSWPLAIVACSAPHGQPEAGQAVCSLR
jgi:hypothetical protein